MKRFFPFIKDFFKRADMVLFSLCLICSTFGLVVISSASRSLGSTRFMLVQIIALFIGIFLYVALTVIDVDVFADKWPILFAFSVIFLCTLLVWGHEQSGNKGWLRFFGIGIQPSEVVKVVYTVLMAKHISYLKEYKNLNAPLSVIQLAVHFGFMFGLVIFVSSDIGSALVFLFIFLVMLYASGLKFYWFLAGIAGVAALFPIMWNNFLSETHRLRILAPYVASVDPTGFGVNWQLKQSKIALASGQLTGTGLYQGTQSQSNAISEKQTDFIFAVIGEELGLIACCLVILLLLAVIARCVYVGLKSKNTMHMLICFGVASVVFFQTFENIGMCIGLTPVIGLTLPFFSYGGSSLFSMFAAMGLVSGVKYRPKPERFGKL